MLTCFPCVFQRVLLGPVLDTILTYLLAPSSALLGSHSQQHPLSSLKLLSYGQPRTPAALLLSSAALILLHPQALTAVHVTKVVLSTTALSPLHFTESLTSHFQSCPHSVVLLFSTQIQYFFSVLDGLVKNDMKQQ